MDLKDGLTSAVPNNILTISPIYKAENIVCVSKYIDGFRLLK